MEKINTQWNLSSDRIVPNVSGIYLMFQTTQICFYMFHLQPDLVLSEHIVGLMWKCFHKGNLQAKESVGLAWNHRETSLKLKLWVRDNGGCIDRGGKGTVVSRRSQHHLQPHLPLILSPRGQWWAHLPQQVPSHALDIPPPHTHIPLQLNGEKTLRCCLWSDISLRGCYSRHTWGETFSTWWNYFLSYFLQWMRAG